MLALGLPLLAAPVVLGITGICLKDNRPAMKKAALSLVGVTILGTRLGG